MFKSSTLAIRIRDIVVRLSFLASPLLFVWWSILAYQERGYFAIGGECGAFVVPFLVSAAAYALLGDDDSTCRY